MSQIDIKPADRLRRKVGYEIERRIVKAIQVEKNLNDNLKKFFLKPFVVK
jgi:hypothetical protein